jgi:hypothetical protein
VAGDFSLWRAGPRLRMPHASIPPPASPTGPTTTTATTAAPLMPPAAPALPALSVYSYYAGLRDRLGDTSLGQAAALPTPAIGYYTYQVLLVTARCQMRSFPSSTRPVSLSSLSPSTPSHYIRNPSSTPCHHVDPC